MVTFARARTEPAKAARRADILAQTLQLWEGARYEDVTLQEVAVRVGLTKAALYGYFPTKESLFLSLYETLLAAFLADLHRHLRLGGVHSPGSLAALLGSLLEDHRALVRLIPHHAGLLERNISQERAAQHKLWMLGELAPVAERLEVSLPGLSGGRGVELLTYTQALVAGLYPMSDPAPPVRAALQDPHLAPMCVTLETALPTALAALYRGMVRSPSTD
ncbi:TetR/AcrR family transcriptional regulator [Deinococcus koreensis]|uniref:TetR/AcrR family transcriptional regulator n=1 Tax=Deinococcus koreensis TaxID=2054903 RepID=A0A2K3V042_9DEIO|nr:TetR family transcriptional regulator [Deinococcus koreensis]PNY82141.1 TetR/AcrR family transcriptional regulator [Deinococcus koreensis]